MHVALVSEHASPLAAIGGSTRAGRTSTSPSWRPGSSGTASCSRSTPGMTTLTWRTCMTTDAGYEVVHVPAGPPRP